MSLLVLRNTLYSSNHQSTIPNSLHIFKLKLNFSPLSERRYCYAQGQRSHMIRFGQDPTTLACELINLPIKLQACTINILLYLQDRTQKQLRYY